MDHYTDDELLLIAFALANLNDPSAVSIVAYDLGFEYMALIRFRNTLIDKVCLAVYHTS